MHNTQNIFATVGLDCLLILWDATKPIPLEVKTLREGATAVAIRGPRKHLHHHHHSHAPLEEHVAVGYNDGEVEIFAFRRWTECSREKRCDDGSDLLRQILSRGRVLACTGASGEAPPRRARSQRQRHLPHGRRGHGLSNKKKLPWAQSSYVKNIDWSFDSDLLQTSCGAYEIMYWSVAEGESPGATRAGHSSESRRA